MLRSVKLVLPLLPFVVSQACSSDEDSNGSATGGATATGGANGSGGSGTGGSQPKAGAPATGGRDSGTGGAANGGKGSTGGASSGGITGNAGTKATGGVPDEPGGSGGTNGGEASGGAPSAGAGGSMSTTLDPCRGDELDGTAYVPDGMCARVVATGLSNVRQITFSSDGALWAVRSNGQISRLRDDNGDGRFEGSEVVDWATTGGNGQNAFIDEEGGFLYSGTSNGVRRWPWSLTTDEGADGEDILTGQPGTGGHSKHTVKVWDGWMYVQSGSNGNVTNPDSPEYDDERSLIKRFRVEDFKSGSPFEWGDDGEVFANGLRNTLGFNRDAMGRIYGVQNGQDDVTYDGEDVHQDNPGEVVLRLDEGTSHGYPFCFVAQAIDGVTAGTQVVSAIFEDNPHDDAWCQTPANALPPVTFVQAHTAPMDIVFYTGPFGALPERWSGGAFISLHGSWNRTTATGYKVIWMPFNADGTAPMPTTEGGDTEFPYEVVFGKTSEKVANSTETWTDGQQVRPVGIAVSPTDGALYISSDTNGRIYRVGLEQ